MRTRLPPVATALIVVNVLVHIASQWVDAGVLLRFALWPGDTLGGMRFEPHQLVTYSFLHGSNTHLFFNMFALFMFGFEVERLLGSARFTLYYFVCVIGAGLAHIAVVHLVQGPAVPVVGASGGVFGLLLAFGMAFPRRRIILLFPPIPMPAWLFVTLYGLAELVMGVTGTVQGVAHFAHLGGMVAGFLLIRFWKHQARAPY